MSAIQLFDLNGEQRFTGTSVGGGGAQPGMMIVRGPFAFAYNTPGLDTGAAIYTVASGDVLLDMWLEITTAWNGATPRADIGTPPFGANFDHTGFWSGAYGYPMDMTKAALQGIADNTVANGNWLVGGVELRQLDAAGLAYDLLQVPAIGATPAAQQNLARKTLAGAGNRGYPILPFRMTGASPLSVCVSQTGDTDGGAPGANQGAANLYVVTATPSPT